MAGRISRKWLTAAAVAVSLLSLLAWFGRLSRTGLVLDILNQGSRTLVSYPHSNLGTSRTDAWRARGIEPVTAVWTGQWRVPDPGFRELVLKSDGTSVVDLDGVRVLSVGTNDEVPNRFTTFVPAGVHRLRVVYSPGSDITHEILLKGITPDGRSVPIERRSTVPNNSETGDRILDVLAARVLPATAVVAWACVLAAGLRSGDSRRLLARGPLAIACLALILAGGLRFEALVTRYWGIEAPDLADAVATEIRALRPGSFEHTPNPHPYEGDPFSYLGIARSMGSFNAPSGREPLFPALTRIALSLFGGRDIGISFLSAACSSLVCLALFTMGRSVGSPWAGSIAALLWAIEWQCISFSVEGWRDDLFTLQVVLCAAGLVRLHIQPDRRVATLLGVVAGLTLLTRLSALTFLVPGLTAAVLLPGPAPRPQRFRAAGLAVCWTLLLAGPFMAACAIAYGDPFYSVNVHAAFYRRRAGLPDGGATTALSFLLQSRLPWEFAETGFLGLTTYPFLNKWAGLGALFPGLGDAVRSLALAGLPVVLWRRGGALLVLVLVLAMAPYAWTWGIPGGNEWRFTLPAYPFYLHGSVMALEAALSVIVGLARPGHRSSALRTGLRIVASGALLAASGLWVGRALDWLRVKEALVNRRPALIEAGTRAAPFFISGWTLVQGKDGSRAMEIDGVRARFRIPAAVGSRVRVILRPGAGGPEKASVTVFSGSLRLATLTGPWPRGATVAIDPPFDPVGAKDGFDLDFVADPPAPLTSPLALLWVRVEPANATNP